MLSAVNTRHFATSQSFRVLFERLLPRTISASPSKARTASCLSFVALQHIPWGCISSIFISVDEPVGIAVQLALQRRKLHAAQFGDLCGDRRG